VNVYTGDVSGAGTDANVFMILFGDKGDSGERKLHKSDTYTDKFERAHVCAFCICVSINTNPFNLCEKIEFLLVSQTYK